MISEEIIKKLKKLADEKGYNEARPLLNKYKDYNVVRFVNNRVPHCTYEGLPYYVVWNDKEDVRPATVEERWEIMALN